MSIIDVKRDIWRYLQGAGKPLVLYGMGDGAEKLLAALDAYGLRASAIFASDEFVRGQSFCGYRVQRLAEVEEDYGDFIILVAFAAGYAELIERLYEIGARHELYAPDLPVYGGGLFTLEYARANEGKLNQVHDLLADDISRHIYRQVLRYKLTGDIGFLRGIDSPRSAAFSDILRLSADESYVDLGAYDGDSVAELLDYTGGARRVLALEPDARNFRKLTRRFAGNPLVEAYQVGAWECDTLLPFAAKAGRNSTLGGGVMTQMRAVDSLLSGAPATLIKLDVEGAEAQALAGAARTIWAHAPKLEVALYHRVGDFFELPLLVRGLHPAYRLYIRKQPYIPAWEVNLYAVADSARR